MAVYVAVSKDLIVVEFWDKKLNWSTVLTVMTTNLCARSCTILC